MAASSVGAKKPEGRAEDRGVVVHGRRRRREKLPRVIAAEKLACCFLLSPEKDEFRAYLGIGLLSFHIRRGF